MKTRAAVLYKTNDPLAIEEVEIPKLKRGQVLVKILATGVCRAQVNERKALKGPDRFLPHLLGHEGAGEVMEVGGGVTKVKRGVYVVCTWIKGKGLEGGASQYKCRGRIINAGPITTFSEYAVISENRLVKIPKKVPPDIASILGCAVPTGMGVVLNTLKVRKGTSIAIFGVGGVGSASILGAVLTKCKIIIAIDITKEKLDFAKHLGATNVINAKEENVLVKIKEKTSGGLDYAIEAAGVKEAMETAFAALNISGKLVIAGNLKKGEKICIVPYDFILGKQIIGTWGGETDIDRDIPYYAEKYISAELDMGKLIPKKYRLNQVNEALDEVEQNRSLGRVVIEF